MSSGPKLCSLQTANVTYFFFADKATWLTPWQGPHVDVEYRLDKLAELLDPARFFRVNRRFLVAWEAIHTIPAFSGASSSSTCCRRPARKCSCAVTGCFRSKNG